MFEPARGRDRLSMASFAIFRTLQPERTFARLCSTPVLLIILTIHRVDCLLTCSSSSAVLMDSMPLLHCLYLPTHSAVAPVVRRCAEYLGAIVGVQ